MDPTIAIQRLEVNRRNPATARDSRGDQLTHRLVSADTAAGTQANRVRLIRVPRIRGLGGRLDLLHFAERGVVPRGQHTAPSEQMVEALQLLDADGGLNVRHSIVVAEFAI